MKPLPISAWDSSLQRVVDDMHGRPLNIHALMANHPRLLNAWWDLRMYLVNGGDLTQRHCELAILCIAVHIKSWYEWASHVVRGIDSGLTLGCLINTWGLELDEHVREKLPEAVTEAVFPS